ncbi:MAG TPA: glucose/quinate/shikimate family membrane-bound PQQ-dependent dehydrogenase [Ferrovibrio sp.]|uniref:glucose/quinate/shikimate family membrane-bound PQQ-dependent dehydrogenase n=1 Tax=Ferrovibrio sp. TaxID=1917215 RepID=UPI002ED50019
MQNSTNLRLVMWISGGVILLLGLILGIGGVRLITLGGSWYYVLTALGLVLTGMLLILRRTLALWLYALVVLGSIIWAIAEIGFDWWPLAARGDIIFIIGLYLLMPWITHGFQIRGESGASPAAWRGAGLPLAVALTIAAVVGVIAMVTPSHDREGQLAMSPVTETQANYAGVPDGDWRAYGRSSYGDRYSPLTQITPGNVNSLTVAWDFHTGDIRQPTDPVETTYEVTPLKIGDTLYLCTPHDFVIALDAESGQERWRYDPKLDQSRSLQHLTCRGVSYHTAAEQGGRSSGDCPERLFLPTADARLIALDPKTGKPCSGFGDNGTVDLWPGMPEKQPGYYYSTSPPVATRDLVIVAGNVSDNVNVREPSGVIRAYDVNTGRLVWNWDSGNPEQTEPIGEGEHYTWTSPNSWSVASADEALGLIYIPMGNQTPDQWGANRTETVERFSSSIVALDIATGKLRWVFQTVHHDLWDMDIGSQPSLVDLKRPEGTVPALVVPTKRGDIYVLDRRTGKPIIPVEERPVPQGAIEGDWTAKTQPFSALTFLPKDPIKESDMWGMTMFDQLVCRIKFRALRYEGIFTPPSIQGSLVFPGNFGIFDWGGIAVDPVRQVAFANPDYMAFVDRLISRETAQAKSDSEDVQDPTAHVQSPRAAPPSQEIGNNPNYGAPYAADLRPFLSPLGLPCQAPPWGYVAGMDLRKGKIVYMHKNGTIRDSAPVPLPFKMGVPSLGGPVITAGGVAFLTSTLDYYIRAYDVATGQQLWQSRLPAGGQATPMTYRSEKSGRQFVVAVAGGHGSLGTKAGDAVIAYALPAR